jgi:hypothetical protein
MRIPRYWASADAGASEPGAGPLRAWGWSHDSHAEAERHARQRLTELLDRLHRGLGFPKGYAYGERPLREEILDVMGEPGREPEALLTRNAYGAVVLNAARVLFVDVDVPPSTLGQRLGGLLGSRRAMPEAVVLDRIRDALRQQADGNYCVYRTAAGFRVAATDRPYAPASEETRQLMKRLGADPSFITLCRVQDSFRARLTPKPWRCGLSNPPGTFPREDPADQAAFAEWLDAYERASAEKATCEFVDAIGHGRTDPGVDVILRLHDDRTKALSGLPLA